MCKLGFELHIPLHVELKHGIYQSFPNFSKKSIYWHNPEIDDFMRYYLEGVDDVFVQETGGGGGGGSVDFICLVRSLQLQAHYNVSNWVSHHETNILSLVLDVVLLVMWTTLRCSFYDEVCLT